MDIENTTTLTVANIEEQTDKVLKALKVKHNKDNTTNEIIIYELFIGSAETTIQIEYDSVSFVSVTLFDKEQTWEENIDNFNDPINDLDLEEIIEEGIERTKKHTKIKAKITKKLEQIQELCEENDLDVDQFVTINYNLDD